MGELLNLAFFVPGMPQTKGSWRIVRGRQLVPDNEHEPAWAEAIAWAARAAGAARVPPTRDRIVMEVRFMLPVPPNKRRTNRRDLDKLARSALDALQGLVYVDDEQVDDLILRKRTTPIASELGAHVRVTRAEEQRP
jgi:Holliday junction resolvase RusA-like endonuclease